MIWDFGRNNSWIHVHETLVLNMIRHIACNAKDVHERSGYSEYQIFSFNLPYKLFYIPANTYQCYITSAISCARGQLSKKKKKKEKKADQHTGFMICTHAIFFQTVIFQIRL